MRASIVFAVLAIARGHEMSVFSWISLVFTVAWYVQASSLARQRATLLNMGAHDWRTQNVFIYWWCNQYLPYVVFSATLLWTLRW